jgi:CheY-like chemotaxis protein
MNLCTNAYHAMEETGGVLTISLENVVFSRPESGGHPSIQPGSFVRLSVGDTGRGILPEIRERIFEPYFTTKEVGKGTGMGLAIVHGIVQRYGGFIDCRSVIGEGTVFAVNLPVMPEESLPETPTDPIIPAGRESILFVDDEEILAEMARTMLTRLGYRVTVRTTSLETLATFENQPEAFDLVITDHTMPGMTGLDLARKMLQIRPDLPIILCTGYSSQVSEVQAMATGISGFALKPLAKADLAALIRKVLDKGQ